MSDLGAELELDKVLEVVKRGELLTLELGDLRLVLFNHSAMVIGRVGRDSLRNQVVSGVTRLNLDDVALLTKRIDGLNEKELDSAVGALRQTLAGTISVARLLFPNLNLHRYTL